MESDWIEVTDRSVPILKFLSTTIYLVVCEEFQAILSPINLLYPHNTS